jgi:hypothetical protein
MYSFTGRKINPLDVQPADIVIEDIAHHLALCNRFAGATKVPLSVAQHSVYAARICWDTPHALQALLHDASETYLGDVTKWLKKTPEMAGYRAAEDRLQRTIYRKYGCAEETAEVVERADRVLVRYEMSKLLPGCTVALMQPDQERNYPPLTAEEIASVKYWIPWTWQKSEVEFLAAFEQLYKGEHRATDQDTQRRNRLQDDSAGHTRRIDSNYTQP